MHSFISLGSSLYGPSGYPIHVARVYPDNGARTTRDVLMACFAFVLLGMVIPVFFLLTKQDIFLALPYISYGIALALYLVFLFRIFHYYWHLRGLEAIGMPFNPARYLSFPNYLRIIAFLPPEGYSNSQTPVQNEDEAIEHDKQS
ncbi:uncharacterized protein TNIN_147431 [Trichonephila inaurata madagascariensis]|uniref:Uncharacterized protein n=1 Tax=Trichonephila inaurata madagascariensis TaxID=2747483 RepID=A0A8X6YQV9_9ARAC|nr:uncharacterized protein TNIN_147431 [Trichonephila inaurata madagascariensis]